MTLICLLFYVIDEEGYVSNTRLCVKDLVAKSEPGGTWIILEWDKTHHAVGPAAGLLAGYLGIIIRMFKDFPIMFESWRDIPLDRKTKFYDSKIKVSLINNYIFFKINFMVIIICFVQLIFILMVSAILLLMMGMTKITYLLLLQRNGRMAVANCFKDFIDGISL